MVCCDPLQLGLPFTDRDGTLAPLDLPPTPRPERPRGLGAVRYVRHRRARRYVLRVEADGTLRVTVPRGGSRREGEAFARRHLDWIARQRRRVADVAGPVADIAARRAQAQQELPQRLRALAEQHGLSVTRISIRNQRTRWGSCGADGHISLNWRLVLMPDWVRDYILVHELMHLRRLDHSAAYWALVAAACPRYQDARRWLRLNGPTLR